MNKSLMVLLLALAGVCCTPETVGKDWLHKNHRQIFSVLEDERQDAGTVLERFVQLWQLDDNEMHIELTLYTMQAFLHRPRQLMEAFSHQPESFQHWIAGLEGLRYLDDCDEHLQFVKDNAARLGELLEMYSERYSSTYQSMAAELQDVVGELQMLE